MEQLLVLSYGDDTTDTRVFPATSTPAAPARGWRQRRIRRRRSSAMSDYLDANGNLLVSNAATPPAGWFYQRVWQITAVSATLKEVRVTATVARSIGRTQSARRRRSSL